MEINVLFHVDELKKWQLVLANVTNILNSPHDVTFIVEVVANSEAVSYYDTTKDLARDANTMLNLRERGVRFVACNNSLISNDIKRDNLLDFVEVVPSGVAELAIKQNDGYTYIKP